MSKNLRVFISMALIVALAAGCSSLKAIHPDTIINETSSAASQNTPENVNTDVIETSAEANSQPDDGAESDKTAGNQPELYQQAIDYIKARNYPAAIGILTDLRDYKDSANLLDQLRYIIEGSYISNGIWAVSGLTPDGKIKVSFDCDDQSYLKAAQWEGIKSLSSEGIDYIVGLTEHGKIVTTADEDLKDQFLKSQNSSTAALADVVEALTSWNNVKLLSANFPFSAAAITYDGRVLDIHPHYIDDGKDSAAWNDIVSVADGRSYMAGLKSDGTVITKKYGYSGEIDTSKWQDIVAISAGTSLIGLKEDGTVVSAGLQRYGQGDVSSWTDIIAISACSTSTLGLKRDGTVVATGANDYGQLNVSDWKDIVAIDAGPYLSIGLKSDGTLVMAGDCSASGAKTPDISGMNGLYVPKIDLYNDTDN